MTGVRFQFHAEPAELLEKLLSRWLGPLEVFLLVEHGREVVPVEGLRALAAFGAHDVPDRVLLRLEPFIIGADADETRRANPDGLAVLLGQRWDDILSESMFASGTSDPSALSAWRSLARRARRDLLRGGTWIGPTGIAEPAPSHRYSPGAARAAAQGTQLLAIAGSARFVLTREPVRREPES